MGPVTELRTAATTTTTPTPPTPPTPPTTTATTIPYSTDHKETALYQAKFPRARLPSSERGFSAAILPATIPSTARASGG